MHKFNGLRYETQMPVLDSPRDELYAQGLAKGKAQIAAYQEAGFKGDTASASRKAAQISIKARVREILEETTQYVRLNADQLLEKIEGWLTVDPANLFDRRGRLRRISEIDRATRMAIQGIDMGSGKRRPVVRFVPRERAAALYSAIAGMTRQEGPLGQTTLESLVSQSLTVNVQVNVNGPAQVQVGAPVASAQAAAPGAPVLEAKAEKPKSG